MFSWGSTFGGFALTIIYLLMSIGALRGLRDSAKPWAVYLASAVGIAVTGAAIFGSVYHVTAPVIYAPYAALALLVLGLVLASAQGADDSARQGSVAIAVTDSAVAE